MKRFHFKKHLCFVKALCLVAMLCAGFSLSAEEVVRLMRFQSPSSDISNISGSEFMSMLTQDEYFDDNGNVIVDEYVVISAQTGAVTLKSAPANATTTHKWGSVAITDGFIKFKLNTETPIFISKVLLTTIGSSTPEKVKINGVGEYTQNPNSQNIVFDVNQKASSITIECSDGYIDFELVEMHFDQPLEPVVYNEAGNQVGANDTDVIVGQSLNVVVAGADQIIVKHNGADKYTFEGENIEFRPMEPGEYTFAGTNGLGTTGEYKVFVAPNQPTEGQHLTLVTDESGLLPGYLYVYQVFTNNDKIIALGTEVTSFPSLSGYYPLAIEVSGDGNSYKNGMETMLLGNYLDGWSWKLTNMGTYIGVDPAFDEALSISYKVTFNQDNTVELISDFNPVYRFCYSTNANCFTVLPETNTKYVLGRLYRIDPIAELPIVTPEDTKENQTVTINGEKCVTRTLTVSFPAPANKPASNYVLRYGDIDLAKFELIGSDYIATATLPYIKGADLMIIGSDSDGTGSFSLGNPWRDLESTVVEQPVGIPAVITINVASGKASFRQALNFESETPCELEISDESHPSGELVKESDGRYYYVIEDYLKDIKTDSNGAPIFSESDKADVNYNVTPVFRVAGAASDASARAVARDAEPYNVYTLRGTTITHNYTADDMSVSGIEAVSIDSAAAPATYYTIDGISLGSAAPATPGLYIRRTDTSVIKILVK